jgi:hypothetical protein
MPAWLQVDVLDLELPLVALAPTSNHMLEIGQKKK